MGMDTRCFPGVNLSASRCGALTCRTFLSPSSIQISRVITEKRLRCERIKPGRSVCAAAKREPQALLFDCDGVLVDTEADGHRVSFNRAFGEKGLADTWDVPLYGELLEIGGGKERMTKYFKDHEDREPFRTIVDPAERKQFIADLHKLKTDLFMDMIESGAMPLRPGVRRLVGEAIDAGVPVAVCSTSNERAVSTIVSVLLGEDVAKKMRVFAGDIVPKKKPDPAIYLLAAQELNVDASRCIVIEDSKIGLAAAKAAGMRCVVTTSSYTVNEDFSAADAVFDCIGEAGDERFSLDDLTSEGLLNLSRSQSISKAAL